MNSPVNKVWYNKYYCWFNFLDELNIHKSEVDREREKSIRSVWKYFHEVEMLTMTYLRPVWRQRYESDLWL